jgi:hypothetical protein
VAGAAAGQKSAVVAERAAALWCVLEDILE